MHKLLLVLLLSSLYQPGKAQSIQAEEASKHIGDSITVCGKVFTARFLETAKNTPTFLSIGAAFPNQPFTVVIWGDVRAKLTYKPEEQLKDKEVCFTGKIEEYKGKPQIVVNKEEQIKIQ